MFAHPIRSRVSMLTNSIQTDTHSMLLDIKHHTPYFFSVEKEMKFIKSLCHDFSPVWAQLRVMSSLNEPSLTFDLSSHNFVSVFARRTPVSLIGASSISSSEQARHVTLTSLASRRRRGCHSIHSRSSKSHRLITSGATALNRALRR